MGGRNRKIRPRRIRPDDAGEKKQRQINNSSPTNFTEVSWIIYRQNWWGIKGDRKNMVRNLVINGSNFGSRVNKSRPSQIENRLVASGSTKISLVAWSLILVMVIILSGVFYLFQVNSIATQGFEIKKIENKIQDAEKENKKLKIKEIELKSMHNIEKATQEFNLVSPEEISYVEIDGPVAMK